MRESKENILFVTIDGGGNLPPVLGLAEGFHERGYLQGFKCITHEESRAGQYRFWSSDQ